MSHRIHLSRDKKFKKVIDQQEEFVLVKRNAVHLRLCASIMSQQLSTKVAAVIYQRFLDLYKKKLPSAREIISMPFDDIRAIGLSKAKTQYILNVCNFFIDNKVTDVSLHKMNDEELIEFLIQIKGIGRWTAEMILMFTLGREDVFAVDDLGIQQAMTKLYNLNAMEKKDMKKEMLRLSEKWRPYRTYACRYLWNWKDNNPKT